MKKKLNKDCKPKVIVSVNNICGFIVWADNTKSRDKKYAQIMKRLINTHYENSQMFKVK